VSGVAFGVRGPRRRPRPEGSQCRKRGRRDRHRGRDDGTGQEPAIGTCCLRRHSCAGSRRRWVLQGSIGRQRARSAARTAARPRPLLRGAAVSNAPSPRPAP